MAALAANKDVEELASAIAQLQGPYRAVQSDEFYVGSLLAVDTADGRIKPGATSTTLIAIGRCEERYTVDASAEVYPKVRSGVFKFENSATTDEITTAEIGSDCYIVDDQTVAKTDGTSTRSVAGKVAGVASDGVWVAISPLT